MNFILSKYSFHKSEFILNFYCLFNRSSNLLSSLSFICSFNKSYLNLSKSFELQIATKS